MQTKRDLFYTFSSNLSRSQSVTDNAIQRIADALQIPRDSLNIIASPRGEVFGAVSITAAGGVCYHPHSKISIPRLEDIEALQISGHFILVVEKEAVMCMIVQAYDQIAERVGPFVVVCGKGYPCVRTTQLLGVIDRTSSQPIFLLIDCDPHGIEIALTYVSGSLVNLRRNKRQRHSPSSLCTL
jgi:meiotic recombination protein SPO11